MIMPGDLMRRIDPKVAYFTIPFSNDGSAVRVSLSVLWSVYSTMGFNKVNGNLYISFERVLRQNFDKPWRYTPYSNLPKRAVINSRYFTIPSLKSGFPHQYKKIDSNTNINFRIARHRNRFPENDIEASQEDSEKVTNKWKNLLKKETVTVRESSKVIGRPSSRAVASLPSPLQYCSLHQQIQEMITQNSGEENVNLSTKAKAELLWWIQNLSLYNDKSLTTPPPHLIISSDASKQGWRASFQGESTGSRGLWRKMYCI